MISAQTENDDIANSLHTVAPITPDGESIVKWKNAYLLIPEKQIIPVREGTHLQVVVPIDTKGQLPMMYHEPKEILTAYLLAIAAAKQLVQDPMSNNQHVNVDMRTIRPAFETNSYGRYTHLVIEIYGRRVKGKHFGEPAPTVWNNWEGERVISAFERNYLKERFAKRVVEQLRAYEDIDLFTNQQTILTGAGCGDFVLWNGGRYQLIAQEVPLLDAKEHGLHFILRNIPEDLQTVWNDPSKTIEMIAIGLGVGRFLKANGFTVNDAFYDINMNWGILWDYFRNQKEGDEKLKELRKELRKRFLAKIQVIQEREAEINKFDVVNVYLDALLSLRPNSVHLHTQFTKKLWEIPSKPNSYQTHKALEEEDRFHVRKILSGNAIGTGHDPLYNWVTKNCQGNLL